MKKILTILLSILVSATLMVHPVLAVNTYSTDLEPTQYWSVDNANLDLPATDNTVEGWFRFESLANDYYQIFDNYNSSNGQMLYYADVNSRWEGIVANGSTNNSFSTEDWNPALETWYHYVWTYNKTSGDVNIWLATSTIQGGTGHFLFHTEATGITNGIGNTTDSFSLGYDTAGYFPFDGEMDDVRVWDDIRTETEMNDNYETELLGTETNLVAYWKFNDDAGVDYTSGVGCNGACDLTNTGSATFNSDVPFIGAVPSAIIPKQAEIIIFGKI